MAKRQAGEVHVMTAFGVALIALGVIGYFGTAAVSVTALIPAIFGTVLVLLGWFVGHAAEWTVGRYAGDRRRKAPLDRGAPGRRVEQKR